MSRHVLARSALCLFLAFGLAWPGLAATAHAAALQPAETAAPAHPFGVPPDRREPNAEERARIDRLLRSVGYYSANGGHSNALGELPELIGLLEQTYGPDHPISAQLRIVRAGSLAQTQRHDQAEAIYAAEIEALRRRLPANDPALFGAVIGRGVNFILWGRPADAEQLLAPLVPAMTAAFGAGSAEHASALANLAYLREAQGRPAEAERLAREALAIREARLDPGNPLLATTRARIASALVARGRYEEARELLDAALAGGEPEHVGTARLLEARGDLAFALARFTDAERDYLRAGELFVATTGFDSPEAQAASAKLRLAIAGTREVPSMPPGNLPMNPDARCEAPPANLSDLWELRVRAAAAMATDEAAACQRIVLAFVERHYGDGHPETAAARHELARILHAGGQTEAAEVLVRQVLASRIASLGDAHPLTMRTVALLAEVLGALGRTDEAVALAGRAEQAGGATVARLRGLMEQARLLDTAGRFADAEALWEQVDRDFAAAGQDLQLAAEAITGYTFNKLMLGKCGDIRHADLASAAETMRRLNPIRHAVSAAAPLEEALAQSLACQGRWQDAASRYAGLSRAEIGRIGGLEWFQSRESALLEARRALTLAGNAASLDDASEAAQRAAGIARERRYTPDFDGNRAVGQLRFAGNEGGRDPLAIAFVAQLRSQWALVRQQGETAPLDVVPPSISEQILNPATAEPLTPEQYRTRGYGYTAFEAAQDLEISAAAQSLLQSAARGAIRDPAVVALVERQRALREELSRRGRALFAGGGSLDAAALGALGRDKAELDRIDAAIRRLAPDYAELVRPGAIGLAEVRRRLRPGEALLLVQPAWDDVYVFAVGRDRFQWHRLSISTAELDDKVRRLRCLLDGVSCRRGESNDRPFDLALAHALYRDVFAPVEAALADADQLFVVAGGSLGGLPLGLLLAAAPEVAGDADPLLTAAWLADRYALITLPSVSSLRAFEHAAAAAYRTEFVGYGDPVLGPPASPDPDRNAGAQAGSVADVATLRRLSSLPGTRRELEAMAAGLGMPSSALRLGAGATESAVRRDAALAASRVVSFATHGLLPRELDGLREPGLVFTPPATASADDDGILTASEAAGLRLAAEWVILSACNTASTDGRPGGQSLSGLARAFLYAGARSLLASHWQVADDATAALTVEAVRIARARPGMSRAQAMQAAMRAVRTGRTLDGQALAGWSEDWADPWYWAPFVLIEAGG